MAGAAGGDQDHEPRGALVARESGFEFIERIASMPHGGWGGRLAVL